MGVYETTQMAVCTSSVIECNFNAGYQNDVKYQNVNSSLKDSSSNWETLQNALMLMLKSTPR